MSEVFEELALRAAEPFERARMLPLGAYTHESVLDAELTEIFGSAWIPVARAAELTAAGDHVVAELPLPGGGVRSVIVVRGDDGTVRAFDNVCLHRGSPLVAACGSAARFTCPYHAWSYRLDGSLIGGPHLDGVREADGSPFGVERHRLGELRVEAWQGEIFVSQNVQAPALAPQLDGLSEVVGRYRMADYAPVHRSVELWQTNWKLFVENFIDAYHVFHVHRATFGATGDSTDDTTVYPGTAAWTHHRVVERDGPDLAGPRTDLAGDWRRTTVLAAVFPAFVMQLQPDWMWSLQVRPVGTDQVRLIAQVSVVPEVLAAAVDPHAYVRDVLDLIERVNAEDRPVIEGVRRAATGRPFAAAPWSPLERNVFDFDQYVAAALTNGITPRRGA